MIRSTNKITLLTCFKSAQVFKYKHTNYCLRIGSILNLDDENKLYLKTLCFLLRIKLLTNGKKNKNYKKM